MNDVLHMDLYMDLYKKGTYNVKIVFTLCIKNINYVLNMSFCKKLKELLNDCKLEYFNENINGYVRYINEYLYYDLVDVYIRIEPSPHEKFTILRLKPNIPISKIEIKGWFLKLDADFWYTFVNTIIPNEMIHNRLLIKYGYVFKTLKTPQICFHCKRIIKKGVELRCGCKFHLNCINDTDTYLYPSLFLPKNLQTTLYLSCPTCTYASNKIKTQFKESYTCPYYKMCKQRLKREYDELSLEFENTVKKYTI
tara:strand:+ start:58 stop:813 length:756 start_codon:yes stop_codon:yes gene_type:complete